MTLKPHIVRAAAPKHLALLPSGITISGVLARCWDEYSVEQEGEPQLIMLGDGKECLQPRKSMEHLEPGEGGRGPRWDAGTFLCLHSEAPPGNGVPG